MIELKVDVSQIAHLGNMIAAAGKEAPHALRRAINHTGDKARTQMRKVLVNQTGLKRKTINKAVTSTRANYGGAAYVIKSKGGNIRLMFFRARETRKGVSAAPWNARRVYPGTFMKGGKFPKRVPINLGGAVVKRAGKSRYPLKTTKSGLFIPIEMVTGQSQAAFYGTAQRELPPRLTHELLRIIR